MEPTQLSEFVTATFSGVIGGVVTLLGVLLALRHERTVLARTQQHEREMADRETYRRVLLRRRTTMEVWERSVIETIRWLRQANTIGLGPGTMMVRDESNAVSVIARYCWERLHDQWIDHPYEPGTAEYRAIWPIMEHLREFADLHQHVTAEQLYADFPDLQAWVEGPGRAHITGELSRIDREIANQLPNH